MNEIQPGQGRDANDMDCAAVGVTVCGTIFAIVAALVVVSCLGCGSGKPAPAEVAPGVAKTVPIEPPYYRAQAPTARFAAESHGEFRGGHNNGQREIFIITDSETGAKYLAITGCGTTELKQSGKTHREE